MLSVAHRFVGFVVLGLVFISHIATAAVQIFPLAEKRSVLVLPKYTEENRQTLADQADFFIRNLFVHRDLKIKDFGTASDPLPKLEALRRDAKKMSNEEFHSTLSKIFLGLHDLHTNYVAPAPLSCGAAFIPVRFEWVKEGTRNLVVVSKKLKIHPEATQSLTEGDVLLAVNGQEVEELVTELGANSGGSNGDAMRVRAMGLLSFRTLTSHALPAEDSVILKMQGASGAYETEIPWYAVISQECLDNADAKPVGTIRPRFDIGEDEFQKRYNKLFGIPKLVEKTDSWDAASPLDEVFEVAVLNTPAGIIGYIKLKAFSWDNRNLDVATVIEGFRRVVEGRLGKAIGLVVDVRGNPGGNIIFAEKLVQLFSQREVEPSKVQMLANDLNQNIFLRANGQDNRWSKAIRTAMAAGKRYITPMPITPRSEANSLGQVWFRPVVVLTDAACYSACDLFSGGMQDSGAGVIIGLHRTTGAGGANVMEYKTFRAIMGQREDNPFVALPFNQNMRVAWRQTVRTGKNAGELLEDKGVESDFVVPLKLADIGLESKELMRRVHQILDELRPKYVSGFNVRLGSSVMLNNGDVASWKESVYGVDKLEVLLSGKKLSTTEFSISDDVKEVEIKIPTLKGEWTDQSVVLLGTRNGRQVFRVVRELMWRGDYTAIPSAELALDLSGGKLDLFRTVLLRGDEGSGWQTIDSQLRIGKGLNYESNVLARSFLPLKLDGAGGKVKFDIKLDAEANNDNLRIYATNPDTGERVHIYAGSHLSQKLGVSIPLPTDWVKADFVFEFESDENWNMAGPSIANVKLSR